MSSAPAWIVSLGLLLSPIAWGPPGTQALGQQPQTETVDLSEIEQQLRRMEAQGFAGAFLIAKDGAVILREGYGMADRTASVPNSPETKFDVGSITKCFTAAAIFALGEQGRLELSDTLPAFFENVPEDKREITLAQLVRHASGLPDILAEGGIEEGEYSIDSDYELVSRDRVVARALASELKFSPGAGRSYSNVGYCLLAAVIEVASDKPYEEYLNGHLFAPAGMRETGYSIPEWDRAQLAVGYRETGAWGTPLDHAWLPDGPSWKLRGCGGMLSTVDDLHAWVRALRDGTLMSAETRAAYFDAMGVRPNARGVRAMGPAGGNGIFSAAYLWHVEEDRILIGLANDARFPVEDMVGKIAGRLIQLGS